MAEIAFRNPEYLLMYRGQPHDHRGESGRTALFPKIFRPVAVRLTSAELARRFVTLASAEKELAERYRFSGQRRLQVDQLLRWSILQHYEICPTPLLDVSISLRVAASFAMMGANDGYLYVLGLPQISGNVTVIADQGIQVLRLLSMCPPQARRPHFQDGYLLGEYPTISYASKLHYERREVDFSKRVLAKFRLSERARFWSEAFPPLDEAALKPDEHDEFFAFAEEIKAALPRPEPAPQ